MKITPSNPPLERSGASAAFGIRGGLFAPAAQRPRR